MNNPIRLLKDQTVGPFYQVGLEKKTIVVTHELENKQVYTYQQNRYPYRPGDGEKEQAELLQTEEAFYLQTKKLKQ